MEETSGTSATYNDSCPKSITSCGCQEIVSEELLSTYHSPVRALTGLRLGWPGKRETTIRPLALNRTLLRNLVNRIACWTAVVVCRNCLKMSQHFYVLLCTFSLHINAYMLSLYYYIKEICMKMQRLQNDEWCVRVKEQRGIKTVNGS